MKKINFFVYLFFSILINTTLFLSCSHFLDGYELEKQLEDAVDYVNSPYAQIEISTKSQETEKIIPAVGYYYSQYKKKDTINLKFESTPAYKFVEWVAEPSNSVEFFNNETIENTHTVNAKIVDDSHPIKIYPRCILLPVVTSYFPNNSSIYYHQDTSIIIDFNKKMNEEDFTFDHIFISNGFTDLSKYFNNPESINDGKSVRIRAKRNNYILNENKKLSITVEVKQMRVATENNYDESMLTIDNFKFSYLIDNSVDDILPSFIQNNFSIYKNINGVESILDYGTNDYELNHLNNSIRINAKAYDKDGDGLQLEIKEEIRKTSEGQVLETQSYEFSFTPKENDVFELNKQYEVYCKSDGLLKLTIKLSDLAGNYCSEEYVYYFVKDTSIISDVVVWNNPLKENGLLSIDDIESSLNTINFSIPYDLWTETKYDIPEYSFYIGNNIESLSEIQKLDQIKKDSNHITGSFNLNNQKNLKNDEDTFIKIKLIDSVGNIEERLFTIPAKQIYTGIDRYGDHAIYEYNVINNDKEIENKIYYLSTNLQSDKFEYVELINNYIDWTKNSTLKGLSIVSYDKLLYSSVSNVFSYDKNNRKSLEFLNENIPEFDYTIASVGDGVNKLTINYKTKPLDGYKNFVIILNYLSLNIPRTNTVSSYIDNYIKNQVSYDVITDTEIIVPTGRWIGIFPGILDENNVPHVANPDKPENYKILSINTDNFCPSFYNDCQSIKNNKISIIYTDTGFNKIISGFNNNTELTYSIQSYFPGCEQLTEDIISRLENRKTILLKTDASYVIPDISNNIYGSGTVNIDTYDMEDGCYFISAEISDIEGNKTSSIISPLWVYTNSKIAKPKIDLNSRKLSFSAGSTDKVKETIPDPDYLPGSVDEDSRIDKQYYSLQVYLLKKGSDKWEKDTYFTDSTKSTIEAFETNLDSDILFVKSMLSIQDLKYNDENRFEFRTVPQYIGNGQPVEVKSISELSDTVYLSKSDQPYIAETFISIKNYGENIEEWVLKARSENVKYMYDLDFYNVNTNNIHRGEYFAVIYHFADGSSLISKVQQK